MRAKIGLDSSTFDEENDKKARSLYRLRIVTHSKMNGPVSRRTSDVRVKGEKMRNRQDNRMLATHGI